jgi:hypothetical protein
MSSKSKKREPSSDLSRHYRRIGIKAVSSAAARKAPSAGTDNLLEQAINCDDAHSAARIIMDALGIETDELANYCLKNWANGSQAACPHRRQLAPGGGRIPGVVTELVGAIRNARLLPWSLHPHDLPGTMSSAHLHRAHRAKGNDDGQDTPIGLRAGGCRDHAEGQARHATGAAAPRSCDRDHASATAPGRAGIALSTMNSLRFPPPWSVEELDACFVVRDQFRID